MTETTVALSNWLAEIWSDIFSSVKCESKWIVVSWIKWEPCNFDQLGAFLSFDNDASHNQLPPALWLQSPPLTILSPPTLPQASHYLGPLITSIQALDQKSTMSEFEPTLQRIWDAQTRSEFFSSKSSFETWLPRSASKSWSVLRNSLKLPKTSKKNVLNFKDDLSMSFQEGSIVLLNEHIHHLNIEISHHL